MGLATLIFGVLSYAIFFATFLYLIVFVGGDALAFLGAPKTIDAGAAAAFAPAALQNIALLLLFGASHSVMARPGFKSWWVKIVSWPAERSVYVLVASLILLLMFAYWRPMPEIVWTMTGGWARLMLVLLFAGFGIVLVSTFLINHFDLFGLKQVWEKFRSAAPTHDPFKTPALYKATRHPIYLGFTIAFWATPTMTAGHLLFASVLTIYMLVAIGYEERDLIARFGDDYRRYMERVPMLFPFGGRKG